MVAVRSGGCVHHWKEESLEIDAFLRRLSSCPEANWSRATHTSLTQEKRRLVDSIGWQGVFKISEIGCKMVPACGRILGAAFSEFFSKPIDLASQKVTT